MNAGKKSEIIASANGEFRVRVFKSQRHIFISQSDEFETMHVQAASSAEAAQRYVNYALSAGDMVAFWVEASPEPRAT